MKTPSLRAWTARVLDAVGSAPVTGGLFARAARLARWVAHRRSPSARPVVRAATHNDVVAAAQLQRRELSQRSRVLVDRRSLTRWQERCVSDPSGLALVATLSGTPNGKIV